jgi:hypothetical protein
MTRWTEEYLENLFRSPRRTPPDTVEARAGDTVARRLFETFRML